MGWRRGGDLFVFFIPNESSHTQPKKKLRIISALITVISVCRLHTGRWWWWWGGSHIISFQMKEEINTHSKPTRNLVLIVKHDC